MRKKILVLVVLILAIVVIFSATAMCFAEEVPTADADAETDSSTEQTPENPDTGFNAENQFSNIIKSFYEKNQTEIITVICYIMTSAISFIFYRFTNKSNKGINTTISSFLSNADNIGSDVVNVINQLINKNNELEKIISEFTKENSLIKAQLKEIEKVSYSTVQILSTVYNQSKNVPQPTKDVVNVHYAEAVTAKTDYEKIEKEVIPNEKQN